MTILANKRFGDFDVYVWRKGKRHKVGHTPTIEQAKELLHKVYLDGQERKQDGNRS